MEYEGYTSVDENGNNCEPWLVAQQHQPLLTDGLFVDKSAANAGNNCRDPLGQGHPVCYSKGALRSCDIPKCTSKNDMYLNWMSYLMIQLELNLKYIYIISYCFIFNIFI